MDDPTWEQKRLELEADLRRAALALMAHTGSAAVQTDLEDVPTGGSAIMFVGRAEHFAELNSPEITWHTVAGDDPVLAAVLAAIPELGRLRGSGNDDEPPTPTN